MAKLYADNNESHTSQWTQLFQYQIWLHALKSQVCEWLLQHAWSLQDRYPHLIQAADLLELAVCIQQHKCTHVFKYVVECNHELEQVSCLNPML